MTSCVGALLTITGMGKNSGCVSSSAPAMKQFLLWKTMVSESKGGCRFRIVPPKSDYYSSYYDELRAGFEIYFRKRLFELVEGRLFYRLEGVVIDDLSSSPSARALSKRRTLPYPSSGSASRVIRGTVYFSPPKAVSSPCARNLRRTFWRRCRLRKVRASGRRFFQTFDAMEQVLTLSGRTGPWAV